ncbi:hypothetical protein FJTKL_05969 [Diaporthe vaccinii]|uniref:Uncharacterized protein n=1 Tax=Diaporthe vaccinii TaxID=105482 RepID=A0ABR4DRT5_9PEZI
MSSGKPSFTTLTAGEAEAVMEEGSARNWVTGEGQTVTWANCHAVRLHGKDAACNSTSSVEHIKTLIRSYRAQAHSDMCPITDSVKTRHFDSVRHRRSSKHFHLTLGHLQVSCVNVWTKELGNSLHRTAPERKLTTHCYPSLITVIIKYPEFPFTL